MTSPSKALITGASTGIGATYADRLARRGHDLILVARDAEKLEANATALRKAGVAVDVLPADLSDAAALATVETRLREDASIGLLINNAGTALPGSFLDADADAMDRLIRLNITALTRLTAAVAPRFAGQGSGAIVNIASVLALVSERTMGIYNATKAYVLALSQTLQTELAGKGVYVQAVLPAATRTEIWTRTGRDANAVPGLMEVGDLVDAALVGFDRRETVTIPPLHDAGLFEAYESARKAMVPQFGQAQPAPRYIA